MTDTTRRALWLSADDHAIDGDRRPNPPGLFEQSLPDLMAQILRIVCGRGVVILSPTAAAEMTLPTGEGNLPTGVDAQCYGAAAQLRAAGFQCREISRWFHVRHRDIPGPGAWIGLEEYFDAHHSPLAGVDPVVMTKALSEWERITGHVWRGSAGDAGNAILRAQTYRHRGRQTGATWWAWAGPDGEAIEIPLLPGSWRRRATSAAIYGYDRVRAYLAAMTCTKVAAERLQNTRLTEYKKGHAGWYLCRVGPWVFEDVFPSPAGYSYGDMGEPVWLSHPTVALLDEVAANGLIMYEVLDSWTAPATPILTNYATVLRQAWQDARNIEDPEVRKVVRAGLKMAFRLGHGYWRSRHSDVQRPDWAAAVTAMSRSNLWRQLWKLWENDRGSGGDFQGPLPVEIDTDNTWFETPEQPAGWTIWDSSRPDLDDVTELGHYRTSGVRRRKAAVSREAAATA